MKILIIILIFILSNNLFCGMFDDVQPDHWAYEAIESLSKKGYIDGFPDGTFRGKAPVSRYEMAVAIYKMLNKIKDVETGGGIITQEDAATIRKLITEFRDELNALGVRIEKLEERVKTLEAKQKSLSKEDNRFRITGDYYGTMSYYRYHPTNGDNKGLKDVNQYINLYLTAKPSDKTEVYIKLDGKLNKPESYDTADLSYSDDTRELIVSDDNTPVFINGSSLEVVSFYGYSNPELSTSTEIQGFSGDSNIFTTEVKYKDKYVSSVRISEGNKNLFHIDRVHFKTSGPRADVRMYTGGEGFSSLRDPLGLLNWNWGWIADIVSYDKPFSGLEVNASLTKSTGFFGSLLRQIDYDRNIYSSRISYVFPKELIPNSNLNLGASYVKYRRSNKPTDFSEVSGIDFTYSYKKKDISATWIAEYLKNRHNVYVNKDAPFIGSGYVKPIGHELLGSGDGVDHADGFWTKLNYSVGSLWFNLEHYKYDDQFWIETAPWFRWRYHYGELYGDSQYVYSGRTSGWINDVVGRGWIQLPNSYAESHTRYTMGYKFNLGNGQSLKTNVVYDRLRFGSDYEKKGELYKFQAWPSFGLRVSGEFLAYKHLDPGDTAGRFKTELKIFTKPNKDPKKNVKWNSGLWAERDADNLDSANNASRSNGIWTEYSYNANDKVWIKFYWNYNQRNINYIDSNGDNKETTDSKFEILNSIDLTSVLSASINAYVSRSWPYMGERTTERYIKLVLNNNFTQNLKGKVGYWLKRESRGDSVLSKKRHFHFDFTYTPDSVTSLNLQYSPGSGFDKNKDEERVIKFSASTKF